MVDPLRPDHQQRLPVASPRHLRIASHTGDFDAGVRDRVFVVVADQGHNSQRVDGKVYTHPRDCPIEIGCDASRKLARLLSKSRRVAANYRQRRQYSAYSLVVRYKSGHRGGSRPTDKKGGGRANTTALPGFGTATGDAPVRRRNHHGASGEGGLHNFWLCHRLCAG